VGAGVGSRTAPRARRRAFAALAVLALLAALAGCGGEEESTTETSAAGGEARQLTPSQEAKRAELKERIGKAREKKEAQEEKAAEAESKPPPEPEGPAPTPSGSLRNEGTEEVAPDVPTAKGGDNSIQEYGTEGPAAERVAAAGILQAYLEARAAGEWATACAYLSASMKEGLAQFGGQGKGSDAPTCAETMRALTQGAPKKALREAAEIRVVSMRIEDEQAFLIYENGKGTPSAIPMADEDGEWRVAAIDGSALFLGA